jgi:glutamate racemase
MNIPHPNKLKNRNVAAAESHRFDYEKTIPKSNIGTGFSESKLEFSAEKRSDPSTCLGIKTNAPYVIGVFDSGLGGLTVVKALTEKSPELSLVYFGDTARFPYGTKSAETVIKYAIENTSFLLSQGAHAIVVACNTATAVALTRLQNLFSCPVYGVIEPAARRAVEETKTGSIGVIGTRRTIQTQSYTHAIHRLLPEARVTALACPLLVSLIEEGCPSEEIRRLVVREYLIPLKQQNIDTLLLGCTHYPLIQSLIQEEMGNSVAIVDPAQACAEVVAASLPQHRRASLSELRFFASDDTSRFKTVGEAFLGVQIEKVYEGLYDEPF